ncbi:LysR family transcriptional regulator [Streptomyces acidiscabies]|uniref:LysR family transcriptional regulator n=1 Tax=Streptomyces acidiscabies TaxID=42234 RepID=UPI0009A0A820|nr:LysR family transcriptional regulator [Streptomyces acidiscabies]
MALDLNLLVPLDALLRERSVTKAAARLGLSQPTVSASLARLRRHFGDELLTRVGNTYELTPLAEQLTEQVMTALSSADRVFRPRSGFDPAHTRREFTLVGADVHVATLGRELAALVSERAPGVRLRFQANTPDLINHVAHRLGEVDGVILPQGLLADASAIELYEDEWACVASAHSVAAGPPTVEELSARPWVVPFHFPWLNFSLVHRLRVHGIEPRVEIAVENFLPVSHLIAGTDRLAVLPGRAIALFPSGHGLTTVDLPFGPGRLVESLWWHSRHERDPAHIWLRRTVAEAGARVSRLGR